MTPFSQQVANGQAAVHGHASARRSTSRVTGQAWTSHIMIIEFGELRPGLAAPGCAAWSAGVTGSRRLSGWSCSVCVLAPVLPLRVRIGAEQADLRRRAVFTLSAYQQLFTDPRSGRPPCNTLEFAAITTACSVVLGGSFAVLCSRTDVPGRRALFAAVHRARSCCRRSVSSSAGTRSTGPGGYAHGFITSTLHIPFNLTSVPGMAVLGTATAVPVVFLVCQAALSAAGLLAGERRPQRRRGRRCSVLGRITLPMLRPALINAGLLVFTLSIESLGIPLVLGSPAGTRLHRQLSVQHLVERVHARPADRSAPEPRFCSPSPACCCWLRRGCSATRPASCRSAAAAAPPAG